MRKFRVRRMPNGTCIAEVKTFFRWKLIVTNITRGDIESDNLRYRLTTQTDYQHGIRYANGSLGDEKLCLYRIHNYATKCGLSKNEIDIEVDV